MIIRSETVHRQRQTHTICFP